jgi:hypothetical protein
MMELDPNAKLDAWRAGTVTLILHFRLWALRNDASPLKVWEMLAERLRLATRQARTVQQWCSLVMRHLRIDTMDPESTRDMLDLVTATSGETQAWLNLIRDELQFLLCCARERFDNQRKESKASAKRPRGKAKKTDV